MVWTPPGAEIATLVPVNAVGLAGGVAVPSIQNCPPKMPVPPALSAAVTFSVTAVPKATVVADNVAALIVGAILSMTSVMQVVAPHLPVASLPRTQMV